MARTIYGNHEKFLDTYYRPYPGKRRRGREEGGEEGREGRRGGKEGGKEEEGEERWEGA